MADELITPEFIERLKADDERWRLVDIAVKIDEELRSSTFIQLILEEAKRESSIALEELALVDPTNVKAITHLQAKIYRDRFIGKTLQLVRDKGNACYDSLREEGSVNPHDYKQDDE